MPIREYKCPVCEEVKERLEMNNRIYGDMKCEKCNENMKRLMGYSNFILKGNGWDKTGYVG